MSGKFDREKWSVDVISHRLLTRLVPGQQARMGGITIQILATYEDNFDGVMVWYRHRLKTHDSWDYATHPAMKFKLWEDGAIIEWI